MAGVSGRVWARITSCQFTLSAPQVYVIGMSLPRLAGQASDTELFMLRCFIIKLSSAVISIRPTEYFR